MDYTVIVASNRYELIEAVKAHLSKGWIPLGGVASSSTNWAGVILYQAMTKPL